MAFLVRKMRTVPLLADFKVVVEVDRTDLRDQLQPSLALAGETAIVAASVADAQVKLAEDVPGIVTIMIQHAQRDVMSTPEPSAMMSGSPTIRCNPGCISRYSTPVNGLC